ncbi:UDP-glucuronosyltransferase 2B15-like [Epargyreus clarus]|uniref:UDP-glucuronosyltransferase 2B15-like n=1 Tax=Epargyreus clarus TaxID=520877 RepID=UPI003C2EEFA5
MRMLYKFSSIVCAFILSEVSILEAARILAFFPTPSISHQIAFRPLTAELVRRGHDVTVITPDPMYPEGGAPSNLTEIDIHDISYEKFEDIKLKMSSQTSYISQIILLSEMFTHIFEVQLSHQKVQEVLHKNKKHYDLVLIEACVRPALILSHIFKSSLIMVSSFGATLNNYKAMGVSTHPFLYPTMIRKEIYNLSLWEKVKALNIELFLKFLMVQTETFDDEVLRRNFGPGVPTVAELYNNVDLLLLNAHPIWVENIPVPPNVVFIGGIQTNKTTPLPDGLESYLNSSKNGVIYLSFGTNVKMYTMSAEKRQKFINVLSKLPYDVLWKWDLDEFPGITDNIRISKWLPQSDLLRHPKVKLFITQGGVQSIDESVFAGVPIIGFPLVADQPYNIEKVVRFKVGLKLNIETFTEEDLRDAITTVIEDKSYRENLVKLRTLMYDQPQRPLERAIWWIEHVLRHGGGKHLRTPAANMSWVEYYELKLVSILLLSLSVALFVITIIMRWLYRKICCSVKIKVS